MNDVKKKSTKQTNKFRKTHYNGGRGKEEEIKGRISKQDNLTSS